MGIGASLILIAAGAILWWAVDVDTSGVDLNLVGTILFVIGIVGLLLSAIFWSSVGSWGPWRRDAGPGPAEEYTYRERTYRDAPPPP